MNVAMLLLAVKLATPEIAAQNFCAALVKVGGFAWTLEPQERRALKPFFSKRLLKFFDDLRDCQQDWARQQPKNELPHLKPPFVDCCVFGTPDAAPTSFELGESRPLRDGRYEVRVTFHCDLPDYKDTWHDSLLLIREDGRWVLDDTRFDYRAGYLLTTPAADCKGPKWIGGSPGPVPVF